MQLRSELSLLLYCYVLYPQGAGAGSEGVEVALDPSELDLDAATMTAR